MKYLAPPSEGVRNGPHRSEWINSSGTVARLDARFGILVRVCLPRKQLMQGVSGTLRTGSPFTAPDVIMRRRPSLLKCPSLRCQRSVALGFSIVTVLTSACVSCLDDITIHISITIPFHNLKLPSYGLNEYIIYIHNGFKTCNRDHT